MNKKECRVTLAFTIDHYKHGTGYVEFRKCTPNEVMMCFVNDTGAEAFRSWWENGGQVAFENYCETYQPDYRYQTSVIRSEMRRIHRRGDL